MVIIQENHLLESRCQAKKKFPNIGNFTDSPSTLRSRRGVSVTNGANVCEIACFDRYGFVSQVLIYARQRNQVFSIHSSFVSTQSLITWTLTNGAEPMVVVRGEDSGHCYVTPLRHPLIYWGRNIAK